MTLCRFLYHRMVAPAGLWGPLAPRIAFSFFFGGLASKKKEKAKVLYQAHYVEHS